MSLPSVSTGWSRTWPPPAYNTVTPRTTVQPTTRPQPSPAASKPRKLEWPPAVRDYVRRAFDVDNAVEGISGAEMSSKLKETITYYAERKAEDALDWATYPLPQQLLLEERSKTAATTKGVQALQLDEVNTKSNLPPSPLPNKRKSQDHDELQCPPTHSSVPPWRKTNLESRMTFAEGHNSKRQKKEMVSGEAFSKFDIADLNKRKERFQLDKNNVGNASSWDARRKKTETENSMAIVVGLNENLEKSYFRLTAPPKPETVRPLRILEQTLTMLCKKWKAEKNYNYICNQFKSLRQDLTVQHIKSPFTVKVYETHARISLEKGDLGEYNQCQTQLKALYGMGLEGNAAEFKAYRILYFVHTCNKTDMNDMLAELTPADKAQRFIKHALDVRSALALGNYHRFFQLYLAAENMGSYLMDMFLERERLNALANISRGYANITLGFLTDELGFENDASCREFLEAHGAQAMLEAKPDDKHGSHVRVKIREGASLFEGLRAAAFSKVDIKGQI